MTAPPLPVAGVRLGTVEAGIRYPDRRDLVVIEIAEGSNAAAVFTRNAFCAAPVVVAREHLAQTAPRYLLINTGNANAATGAPGLADARQSCQALADLSGCAATQVLPFSTGVIGERLPLERLRGGLPRALAALDGAGWEPAAHGILTTDTRPKWASRRVEIDGRPVTVTGIAKGSGMICPDMATMLAFIATDAAVEKTSLQRHLQDAVAASFNAVTVDGDTSTNDACVLLATGRSGVEITEPGIESVTGAGPFREALGEVCRALAQALVRDGEGATKFITVHVEQGRDLDECRRVAYTVAHSPLVKTAFFASDPNWGRLVMAVGRAGLDRLDPEALSISLDDVCIVDRGGRAAGYTEERGQAVMRQTDITVRIVLGRGSAGCRIWTTDFSYDYVRINAEYRS